MPNEQDQKKSVLLNVEVRQKFQKSKGRSKRTHTWRWMGLVRRTKRAQQNGPNKDYAQCRTNTRETVAWLQKGEAPRFAHLPLFSLSLLLTSLWTLLYLWTMDDTHTHYLFLLFLSLFFDWEYLFSLSLGPLQNLVGLGINIHSHNVGSSVRCFATRRKPFSKDKVTKRKRGFERRRKFAGTSLGQL
jgi:hypothetical protein